MRPPRGTASYQAPQTSRLLGFCGLSGMSRLILWHELCGLPHRQQISSSQLSSCRSPSGFLEMISRTYRSIVAMQGIPNLRGYLDLASVHETCLWLFETIIVMWIVSIFELLEGSFPYSRSSRITSSHRRDSRQSEAPGCSWWSREGGYFAMNC
ncbi:hypothetical protein BJ912DRAFT_955082 [Pholiota molesta]|nr:hypothetical protein BJ912DRAFT_955082 [Pholiota molesta]